MVFERTLSYILNKFLGDFVENLDGQQLNVGIWGGDVELLRLLIKPSALNNLDLPIQIIYGTIGKLVLKIPWKRIYTSPTVICIEDIYLLIVPNQEVVYNEEKEQKTLLETKRRDLRKIEEAKKAEAEKDKPKTDPGFVEKLITNVIKNVQISIRNIHIRYEDKVTNPNNAFTMGFTLSNLDVESTDANWKKAIVNDISKIYKVLQLDGLAIYFNCNSKLYGNLQPSDMVHKMAKDIASKDGKPSDYTYVLGPIKASARLRINQRPEVDAPAFSIPKIHLNLDLQTLFVGVSKAQYRNIIALADSLGRMSKGAPYRKFRPKVDGYRGHYKKWWKFAYNCVLLDIRRVRNNWSWRHMRLYRDALKEYTVLYKKLLTNKTLESADDEWFSDCEKALDLTSLVIIRQQVEIEMERQAKEDSQKSWFGKLWGSKSGADHMKSGADISDLSTRKRGWIYWLFGRSPPPVEFDMNPRVIMKQFEKEMTPEEKTKLYKAIGYTESASPVIYPIEFVDNSCTFLLRTLEVQLWDEESEVRTILLTDLTGVKLKVETRSAASALKVNVNIDNFKTTGLRQADFVPEVIISEIGHDSEALLDVTFETNPLDGKCDQRIQLDAQPIRIVYDAQTINKIVDVFKVPADSDLYQIQAAADSGLTNVKEMTSTGLQHSIDRHARLDIDVNLCAPYVIIPYGGKYTGAENVLVCNLGRLRMFTLERLNTGVSLRKLFKEGMDQTDIYKQLKEQSYDKFRLELTDLQILIAQSDEDWKTAIGQSAVTEMHMLNPVNLSITYSHCLISDDPRLPLNLIAGELPSIDINISEARVMLLVVLGTSIPLPHADMPEPQPLTRATKGSSRMLLKYKEMQENARKARTRPPLPADVNRMDLVQFTTVQANFVMSELAVTINKQESLNAQKSPLACFQVKSLECNLIQQTHNTRVSLLLGDVLMKQNRGSDVINIISTPPSNTDDQYLFKVEFTQVDHRSPELHSIYKSCEANLLLDFRVLDVLLHQEGLLSLVQFGTDLRDQILDLTNYVQRDRVGTTGHVTEKGSTISTILETSTTPARVEKQRKRVPVVVETIKFKLRVDLQEVSVKFATDRSDISSCAIRGITADVIVKDTYTQVNAKLQEMAIIDLNPNTVHNLILSGTADCALIAQIVVNNLDGESDKPDIEVTIKVGGLRVVFLNWFVSNMLNFLNQFQAAQQAIIDASQAAAKTAKANMKDVYAKATKVSLNIDLKAPDIIVPVNSMSYDAIFLDLGIITLTNKFLTLDFKNEEGFSAVLDELKVSLSDFKISRVKLDEQLAILGECELLEPINVNVIIKRNLSSSWYTFIPDIAISVNIETIELLLRQADYHVIMSILSGNLAEGEKPAESRTQSKLNQVPSNATNVTSASIIDVPESPQSVQKPHVLMKFTFLMEQFIINMYTGGVKSLTADTPSRDPSKHFARFSLEYLSVKGRISTDRSMVMSVLLVNCLLDDMRRGREGKLTRLIERSMGDGDVSVSSQSSNESLGGAVKSMVDVTFQQKESDMFADLRICSFTIILSVEYLLKLADFFNAPTAATPPPEPKPLLGKPSTTTQRSRLTMATGQVSQHSAEKKQNQMTINLKVEKPDIILVEHMDNINTKAMILNSEILVKVRIAGEHQVINGVIKDLQLYTCNYNPAHRAESRANILHPLNISLAGSTPQDKGLHLELLVTDIRLGVSPETIELLNRVMVTMSGSDVSENRDQEETFDYIDLWKPKDLIEADYWFVKTDYATEASESIASEAALVQPRASLQELCIISMPSVVITIEAGVGNKTLPMLLFETNLKGSVRNWSSQMSLEASLTVQMGYFNSRLALWEPLIEPVEVMRNNKLHYAPWELKFEMSSSEHEDSVVSPQSDTGSATQVQPIVNIDIISESTLEITVTKTCLEVLQNLAKAFASAMESESIKTGMAMQAPYKVLNEIGEDVTLLLERSSFIMAQGGTIENINKSAAVPLQLKAEERENQLQLSKELMEYSQTNRRYLYVKIKRLNWEVALPVVRADKRFFMLNYRGEGHDNWGIISDIIVDEGVTIITLRSILQVYNHFNIPVEVYFMTSKGNELELVGAVQPNGFLNIPLRAVYTPTSELFFTVAGHSVTCAPYVWKDLQSKLNVTKLLQCPHKDVAKKSEPFIFKVVGETEQVYYENTSRHTMASTCYNIHLRPAVILKNCLPIPIVCCVDERPEEFGIQPGDTIQLPNVDPGKNVLVIRIPDYLEKEWSCRQEVSEQPSEFVVWSFNSYDSAMKMCLDLGMHTLDKNGSLIMSLYCPFWMLNKTGLMLGYRSSDENLNVLYHPADFKGPILFSFNPKNFFGKKKASIRVEYGEWSDKFSLDVAGSSGLITCKTDDRVYQVGVNIHLTYNTLTKQVTFIPFYVIINNAPFPIECQESDRPADPWITVEPKSCSALWPHSELEDKLLHLRVADSTQLTAPFIYTESHNTLLRLNNKYGGINVDIQLTEGAVYINLAPYEIGSAPALLVNHTNLTIKYWEKESIQERALEPKCSILYAWENPSGPRVLCWEKSQTKDLCSDLRKDGCGEFSRDDTNLYWASFLDGMQRVLLFTEERAIAEDAQAGNLFQQIHQEINVSIHGVGLSLVNNIDRQDIMYLGIASSGVIWETCKVNGKRFKPLGTKESTHLEAAYQSYLLRQQEDEDEVMAQMPIMDGKILVDFSTGFMVKPSKRKIRRTFQTGLWVQIKSSPSQTQLHAKINRLQIDDQMFDCIFPVVLAPIPPPKSVAVDSGIKPFVEVSIVQLLMKNSQIRQFKYFKVLVQEFHIKVDLGFVNAVLDFLEQSETSDEEQKKNFLIDKDLVDEPLYAHVSSQSQQEQKSFYDLLHFSPLKVHISFSLAAGSSAGQTASTPNFLHILLQGIGVTLTDLQDVIFKLSYFERGFIFLTQKQLVKEAVSHYVGQSIKQLYVLVLGLDVIGNPYGLVLGITKGVEDLFYEPFQGAIQGPDEFAEGLALGIKSLFGHTVGGAAGAMSRITGAMGKGIAALTFDDDYQRKRREAMRKKPTTVQEGIARSGKGLVMGVYSGVTGVFTKPVEGAKEQGVEGFFKGLGKGAVGLVTRPVAGVVDFASGSLDVVKRYAETGEDTMRLRAPRFLQADGLVRPYNKHEAIGHRMLSEMSKGKYSTTDVYVAHYEILPRESLLLTNKRVAYVVHSDIFGGWQIEWSYTWDQLPQPPRVVPKGVLITTIEKKKKLFTTSDLTKTVLIDDPSIKEEICVKMESLRGA